MKKHLFLGGVVLSLVAFFGIARAAMLGVKTGWPVIAYSSSASTSTRYNPVSQIFSVVTTPTQMQFTPTEAVLTVRTGSMSIQVQVDNTGALVGGVAGPDLVISGSVRRVVGTVTNTYTGLLLTGEVQPNGFGYAYSGGGVGNYDLRFSPTGGLLLPFFQCDHLGVTLTSAGSTFTGSFTTNFQGQARGNVGLEDLTPPTVTCPSNITVECNADNGGLNGAYVYFPDPVGTDNCDTNITFVYTPPSGSFFALNPGLPNYTNYVVALTATDASGNQSTCTFTVTVQDTLAPQFNDISSPVIGECGEDPFVLTNDTGQCYATFTFAKPTATNLCCVAAHTVEVSAVDEYGAVISLTNNGNGTVTGLFPVTCAGTNIITIVAWDDHGNSAVHQCGVLVVDNEPPVITCSNQIVECTGGAVFYEAPSVFDNCPNVTVSCTPSNGSALAIGTNLITCTAADCSGNTNQCTFDVIVQDTTPPVISCPPDVTVECGQSTDPSSTGIATASDTCDATPTVTFTDAVSGSCPQTITRTWKATDASGNSATCVQTITIRDTTPPTISCPPDKQLQCGDSTAPSNTGMATATDNCDTNVTVSYTDVATPANCTGKPGIDRTWKATDACGNVATCVQHITYVDTTPPTITAVPTGSNLGCNPATPPTDASVKALVTATDNCGVPTVNVSHVDASSGCAVTRTFTVTAADGCGNTSAAQTVVYTWTADTTPPTVTVPAGSSLGCNPASLPTDASVKALVTATDDCGVPTVNVSHLDASSGCMVTRTFTVTATDGCGNTSAAQTVVYSWTADTTPPTITAVPTGSNLGCNPASLPTDASVKALVTATDNCGVPTVNVSHVDANNGCAVTRTFTVTATDGCGNTSAAQTVVYTWTADTTPPTITAVPTGGNLGCNPASLPTDASVKALVTATDNCGVPTVNVSHVDTNSGCAVTRTFTVTATDGCGNTSAAQTVVYSWTADTTPPTIAAVPAGSNLGCNPATLPTDASVKALVTATDNCSVPSVNVTHVDANNGCAVTRTFTVTATDGCGNISAAQTVVYTWTADTTPPTITCPDPVTVQCASNMPPANVASVTATDNCGIVTVSFVGDVVTNQTCPNRYTIFRTYKAVDPCGNSATCTQTITVNDTTRPSITCPANVTVSVSSLCTNVVPATDPTIAAFLHGVTASDNCGGSATVTNNAPSSFLLGTNTVTFTATDSCGNTTNCQANVIVVAQVPNCEPIQTSPTYCQHYFDGFGNCKYATFEGSLTLTGGDQPSDFRTASNAFVALTVTIGANAPVVVYCNSQTPLSVQSDMCGGEAWEFFGRSPYERVIFRFEDNQKYNALMDPNLPSSAATGYRNVGKLSTVSIGATQTRFYYAFQQAKQPITIVVDGIVLLSVSNNVASSTFPLAQCGATVQVTFPERLVPGNTIQWYATGNPSAVSSNNLIYSQQASANGNSTATYFNDGGVFEIQVPVSGINFNSNNRGACVQFMLGQPGVTPKVGCGTFCPTPIGPVGNQCWQFGRCSDFDDEFDQENWSW